VPKASEARYARDARESGRRSTNLPRADAIVAAVAHKQYPALGLEEIGRKVVSNGRFADVKSGFDAAAFEKAGLAVWLL
jgi:UDP-N-acetyl-D-galactosamine dehydrogenase